MKLRHAHIDLEQGLATAISTAAWLQLNQFVLQYGRQDPKRMPRIQVNTFAHHNFLVNWQFPGQQASTGTGHHWPQPPIWQTPGPEGRTFPHLDRSWSLGMRMGQRGTGPEPLQSTNAEWSPCLKLSGNVCEPSIHFYTIKLFETRRKSMVAAIVNKRCKSTPCWNAFGGAQNTV